MNTEIWVSGPEIEITLCAPRSSEPSERLTGIIDTGASVICLDRRIAIRLGLIAVNRKQMQVADGNLVDTTAYMAGMIIPGLRFEEIVEVFAVEMPRPSSRVLLGRSFLKHYIVTYNGPEELFHYFHAAGGTFDYTTLEDG